jgi:hypothetical protein
MEITALVRLTRAHRANGRITSARAFRLLCNEYLRTSVAFIAHWQSGPTLQASRLRYENVAVSEKQLYLASAALADCVSRSPTTTSPGRVASGLGSGGCVLSR